MFKRLLSAPAPRSHRRLFPLRQWCGRCWEGSNPCFSCEFVPTPLHEGPQYFWVWLHSDRASCLGGAAWVPFAAPSRVNPGPPQRRRGQHVRHGVSGATLGLLGALASLRAKQHCGRNARRGLRPENHPKTIFLHTVPMFVVILLIKCDN